MLANKRILLIIAGGIAAYKTLELTRLLTARGAKVRAVLTKAGAEFVTQLSLAALTGDKVYTELFDLKDESEMGHIALSREADLVVVAPATADLMAKLASGLANDLASTVLLATDKPVLLAPAMNVRMWEHPATQRNVATLHADGHSFIGPESGAMACGEFGMGRMAEPAAILDAIEAALVPRPQMLTGKHIVLTSGPTHEPIDPVRYIANRSSGKQGHAIAAALAQLGAQVTLIAGPVHLADPAGVRTVHVETAREMLAAVKAALPADGFVAAAAVADWRTGDEAAQKIKKEAGKLVPVLAFVENPDILATISKLEQGRPRLVVGFAAETEMVITHAISKRERKGCDWIVANDVSPSGGVMGGDENTVHLITANGTEDWPKAPKDEVARRLAARIAEALA